MRKLLLLLLALLIYTCPAMAEETTIDTSYEGTWVADMSLDMGSWFTSLTITSDGVVQFSGDSADVIRDPKTGTLGFSYVGYSYTLTLDSLGQLIVTRRESSTGAALAIGVYHRSNAPRPEKPTMPNDRLQGTAGTWQIAFLCTYNSDNYLYASMLDNPPGTLTLDGFATNEQISEQLNLALEDSDLLTPTRQYAFEWYTQFSIDMIELCLPDRSTSRWTARYPLYIYLTRVSAPAVDESLLTTATPLMGEWKLWKAQLNGVDCPAEALENPELHIDTLGYARLESHRGVLQLADDGSLLLQPDRSDTAPYRLTLVSEDELHLSISDSMTLHFVTQRGFCRRILNGAWEISGLRIPSLGDSIQLEPGELDVQLVITEDDQAHIISNGQQFSYRISAGDEPGYFTLTAPASHDLPADAEPAYTLFVNELIEHIDLFAADDSHVLGFTRITD